MEPIIRVSNLQKTFRVIERRRGISGAFRNLFAAHFREVRAVDGVSFNIETGEIVGYLGPNGAGKSTTLKILTGLLVPTTGDAAVLGMRPWKERERYVSQIGAVFGQRTTLYWDLPVLDTFEMLQAMYGVPLERYKSNLADFSRILEMDEFIHTPVRSLSLGQRMRADLCAALLHEPRILFLDEPTIGLDVVAKERIRRFIQYVNAQRDMTVLLTTHDLSDVEKLCQRVLILDHGQLLYDGGLGELTERYEADNQLVVTFADDYTDILLDQAVLVRQEDRRAVYRFNSRQVNGSELVKQLLERFHLADFEIQRPQLEDTIRRIYEQRLLLPNGRQHPVASEEASP